MAADGAAERQHRARLVRHERGRSLVVGPRTVGDLARCEDGGRLGRPVHRCGHDRPHGDCHDDEGGGDAHAHTLAAVLGVHLHH